MPKSMEFYLPKSTENSLPLTDVKGKIGIAVKRLEIKGFKTKGSIFECCFWSFFFLSVETYRKAENGRVVATLLI